MHVGNGLHLLAGIGSGFENLLVLTLDDGEFLVALEPMRDDLHHFLHGLTFLIQGFLPDLFRTHLEVGHRLFLGEIPQGAQVIGLHPITDMRETRLKIPRGTEARQRHFFMVEPLIRRYGLQFLNDAGSLRGGFGKFPHDSLRHRRGYVVLFQPAENGGAGDRDMVGFEKDQQLTERSTALPQRREFFREGVQSGAMHPQPMNGADGCQCFVGVPVGLRGHSALVCKIAEIPYSPFCRTESGGSWWQSPERLLPAVSSDGENNLPKGICTTRNIAQGAGWPAWPKSTHQKLA